MTDTRRQILQTIRDQARLVQQNSSKLPPHTHTWSVQHWWEAFQFLFIACVPPADSTHHDDLLFFTKSHKHPNPDPPYFVRRKGKQLPPDLQLSGESFDTVNWAETVLLNIVLQSQYQLTVVTCGREALPFVAEGRTWSSGMITVSKPVYASTTITAVNLDSSRADASNPQPCYPDICFAVDNFDNAFDDLVLEDADRCYCVVLHAILDDYDHAAVDLYPDLDSVSAHATTHNHNFSSNSSLAAKSDAQQQLHNISSELPGSSTIAAVPASGSTVTTPIAAPAARTSSADGSPCSWQIGTRRRTLFAGYVAYGQVLDFLDTNGRSKSIFDAFWGYKGPTQDKVVMTGPGGVGRCEVAVRKVVQQQKVSNIQTPAGHSGTDLGNSNGSMQMPGTNAADAAAVQRQRGLLQVGLHNARRFASGLQQALSDIDAESMGCHMQCALMLLKLPVRYLANELLDAA